MPRGDGTGPNGQGPMTGRGMGFCAGFNAPGFVNGGFGRGMAKGRGYGWRARAMQQNVPAKQAEPAQESTIISDKEEKEYLKEELEALKEETKEIEKRLKDLE